MSLARILFLILTLSFSHATLAQPPAEETTEACACCAHLSTGTIFANVWGLMAACLTLPCLPFQCRSTDRFDNTLTVHMRFYVGLVTCCGHCWLGARDSESE